MINYIIGIDAGGTTTKGIAYDANGEELANSITGPGSAAVVSEKIVWQNVEQAIAEVVNKLSFETYHLNFIQIGLSAFSILEHVEETKQKLMNLYNVSVSIESDTLIACHSILKTKYKNGVVALAGTGVAIYGIKDNQSCLIGGWGHIIRELGSAYAAVHHFAINMIDAFEQGKEYTLIQNGFLELLRKNNIKDLKHLFYYHSKNEIASYVTYIKNEALKGNKEAALLLEKEGMSLAIQTINAINKLQLESDYVIGLRGGFAQKQNKYIVKGFKKILKQNNINVELIDDDEDPAKGSYYLAKSKNKI